MNGMEIKINEIRKLGKRLCPREAVLFKCEAFAFFGEAFAFFGEAFAFFGEAFAFL